MKGRKPVPALARPVRHKRKKRVAPASPLEVAAIVRRTAVSTPSVAIVPTTPSEPAVVAKTQNPSTQNSTLAVVSTTPHESTLGARTRVAWMIPSGLVKALKRHAYQKGMATKLATEALRSFLTRPRSGQIAVSSRDAVVRVRWSIPNELVQAAHEQAVDSGTFRSVVMAAALEAWLRGHS